MHLTMRPAPAKRLRFSILCCSVALLVAACGSDTKLGPPRSDFNSGIPGVKTAMQVESVQMRGPYLVAHLKLTGKDVEAYTMPSEVCKQVFVPGDTVAYNDTGPQGVYLRGDLKCQAFGFGNLVLWRDRNIRSTASMVPRSQANYRTIYEDDQVALLRGFFPEAGHLGYSFPDDIVAVVPRGGECEVPIEKGVASIEYRSKGPRVLSLVGPTGLCEIRALANPPPDSVPREK